MPSTVAVHPYIYLENCFLYKWRRSSARTRCLSFFHPGTLSVAHLLKRCALHLDILRNFLAYFAEPAVMWKIRWPFHSVLMFLPYISRARLITCFIPSRLKYGSVRRGSWSSCLLRHFGYKFLLSTAGNRSSAGTDRAVFLFLVLREEGWLVPASSCNSAWTGCTKSAPGVFATVGKKWSYISV